MKAADEAGAPRDTSLFPVPGTDAIGAWDVAMLALLYGAGLQRSEAVALQLADYDQVSGVITVRRDEALGAWIPRRGHDARQVFATGVGKAALDTWIARRGDWPGPLLCPIVKGGRIQQRDLTADAVIARVRSIAEQAGVDPVVTPNDLRHTHLTDAPKKDRRPGVKLQQMAGAAATRWRSTCGRSALRRDASASDGSPLLLAEPARSFA